MIFLLLVLTLLASTADPLPACPSAQFMTPPNATGGTNPDVKAWCEGSMLVVQSNGVPGYAMSTSFRNDLVAQSYDYKIPLVPRKAPTPTELPLLGAIGITLTGIPIYPPNEAKDLAYGDAMTDGILDSCHGHTGPNGAYHFHGRPECPFSHADYLATATLGYAFDGYPIMAPYVCTDQTCRELRKIEGSWHDCVDEACTQVKVREVDSSWVLKEPSIKAAWDKFGFVEGSGDLDRCNGMVGPDGMYRYYATDGFPYNLGCYRGVVQEGNNPIHVGWSQHDEWDRTHPGNRPPNSGRGPRR